MERNFMVILVRIPLVMANILVLLCNIIVIMELVVEDNKFMVNLP